jgi:hypothetical protein
MKVFINIIIYIFRALLVYWAAIFISNSDREGKIPGTIHSPKMLIKWTEPSFLYYREDGKRNNMRITGIAYHILFAIPSFLLFPIFIIFCFIDIHLADKLYDFWFSLSGLMAFLILSLDFVFQVTLSITRFVKSKIR